MERVLVAMSGGVDSSMVAYLLKKQGYEVIGLTFINYIENQNNPKELQFIEDAKAVAAFLGIKHVVIDIQEDFKPIIEYFVKEYINGRTPNPCVYCNPTIKWNVLIEHADLFNAKYIATGHYAIKKFQNGRYFISQATDPSKDQSYFLYRLPQKYLERTLFPLGTMLKTEVKKLATELGLTHLVQKSESYDVCFIKNQDYRDFIKKYAQKHDLHFEPGPIVDNTGKQIGIHLGIPFYTIGQRRGLGIATGQPMYVKKIDPKTNTITVAPKQLLAKKTIYVADFNLMKYPSIPPEGLKVITKIRYRDKGTPSTIYLENDKIRIDFHQDVYGVTPGQSAVFYEGPDVVGGGIIQDIQ